MARKLNVGLIGCGGNGRSHLRRLVEHPGIDVVGLADTSDDARAATVEQVPEVAGTPSFADYREMLAKCGPDAAVISTPHTLHCRQVLDCLNAGLHVLCEKPLTTSAADAKKIVKRARETRRAVVVSFQRRLQAMRRSVRSFVRRKSFGRPLVVQSLLVQEWLKRQSGTWRQDPKLSGGGQLNDSGAHVIDMLLWTMPSRPVEVAAMIDNRGSEVDIDSAICFRFEDGTVGTLTVAGASMTPKVFEDMTIVGDGGYGVFYRDGELSVRKGTETVDLKISGENESPDHHFYRVVRRRAKNQSPPEDFLTLIAFTEACWRSARQGGKVVKVRY
jgi:predicted dehydrogenase